MKSRSRRVSVSGGRQRMQCEEQLTMSLCKKLLECTYSVRVSISGITHQSKHKYSAESQARSQHGSAMFCSSCSSMECLVSHENIYLYLHTVQHTMEASQCDLCSWHQATTRQHEIGEIQKASDSCCVKKRRSTRRLETNRLTEHISSTYS